MNDCVWFQFSEQFHVHHLRILGEVFKNPNFTLFEEKKINIQLNDRNNVKLHELLPMFSEINILSCSEYHFEQSKSRGITRNVKCLHLRIEGINQYKVNFPDSIYLIESLK